MNYCNTLNYCQTRRHPVKMELESEEDLIKIPHHEADIEQYIGKLNKVSEKTLTVFERCDSSTECDEDLRPKPEEMEEKSFMSRLYSFMKDKGTPIERIPHLGFKQINLWRIFKAVEKLGGYDSVTARRLWKSVYDELGGSPGSTSAATCTRRHYERLVLPFERRLAGEEDKPLPPRKPRKPYKRNLDGRVSNIEGKKKRTQRPDKEMDSESQDQRIEEAETGTQALSTPWNATSDRLHPDRSQAPRGTGDRCTSSYTCSRVLQAPPSGPWSELIQPAAGEVISPLEKKKRMAQASLSQPLSPQGGDKDKDRPSVIYSSQPVIPASSNQSCNSSEGSPLPLSSSSSRSASPYSVSSEDCPPLTEDKPASNTQPLSVIPKRVNDAHGRSDSDKSPRCSPMSIDLTGPHRDLSHTGYQSLNIDSNKSQTQGPAWKPVHKGSARSPAALVSTPSSLPFKNNWTPASTSGFTKVMPKIVQPLRPTPYPPGCKVHQSGVIQHEGSLTCAKKLHKMAHWLYQAEKREKAKTGMPKTLSTQPTLSHYNQPASYLLTGCDRPARDSWPQLPPHQAFIPGRMRLPQYQSTYRQIPMIPFNSTLIGSAFYSYPNSFPMWSPQAGYTLPGMSSTYPHKM